MNEKIWSDCPRNICNSNLRSDCLLTKPGFIKKRKLTNAQALEGVGESKEFSIDVISFKLLKHANKIQA